MNEHSPPPTMQKIAQAAGVSVATVSLCLRNHPRFPAETCLRIQSLAREMGYRPNPLVSTLMAHLRSIRPPEYAATIGFINGLSEKDVKVSITFQRYLEGARRRAEQMGYRLDELNMQEPGMTMARLSRVVVARGIAGIVIGPVAVGRGHLRLDWPKFASAAIGYSMWRPNIHRVTHNQFRSTCMVVRQLYRLGYQRIGLAMSSNFDERVDHNWLAGLLVTRRRDSASDEVPPFISKSWDRSAFSQWFKAHQPDVVVSPQYEPYDWLASVGAKVPDDVGFAHLDLIPIFENFSGIEQRSDAVGAAAIDSIAGQFHRNERGIPSDPKLVLLEGQWVQGRTVREMSPKDRRKRSSKKFSKLRAPT